jgi:hypothetical protein
MHSIALRNAVAFSGVRGRPPEYEIGRVTA